MIYINNFIKTSPYISTPRVAENNESESNTDISVAANTSSSNIVAARSALYTAASQVNITFPIDMGDAALQDGIVNYIGRKYPSQSPHAQAIAAAIVKYSEEANLNPALMAALIEGESGFNPRAVSPDGNSRGLGQLSRALISDQDKFNIDKNIQATVAILKDNLSKVEKYAGGEENKGKQIVYALTVYKTGQPVPSTLRTISLIKSILPRYEAIMRECYRANYTPAPPDWIIT